MSKQEPTTTNEFGKALFVIRKKYGFSQKDISLIIERHVSYVSDVETARKLPFPTSILDKIIENVQMSQTEAKLLHRLAMSTRQWISFRVTERNEAEANFLWHLGQIISAHKPDELPDFLYEQLLDVLRNFESTKSQNENSEPKLMMQ